MIRIGVDFGGTKIEVAAIDPAGRFLSRSRRPNPRVYDEALQTVADLVAEAEQTCGEACDRVGVAAPGSISPRTGDLRNANSTWLNGRPFRRDLETALGRPVRLANDANCLALSEAVDGAASYARVVFAVILGTGCGGGLAVERRLVEGFNGVAGEIGHMPLPWPTPEEVPGVACWCGLKGCLETYVSGTGFERDFEAASGRVLAAPGIVAEAREGDAEAAGALDRYVDRLARGLAVIVDMVDPDAIVLGGGMSNVDELYPRLPGAVRPLVFSDLFETPILKAAHGDSSGVRGAAWLWPLEGP
jgi:fructokinase